MVRYVHAIIKAPYYLNAHRPYYYTIIIPQDHISVGSHGFGSGSLDINIIVVKPAMKLAALVTSIAAVLGSTYGQQDQYPDYQDYADGYEQDNLYENYAIHQQEKAVGAGGG